MTTTVAQQLLIDENWINKYKAAEMLDISTHTLKTYRQKFLLEDIHFLRLNSRCIRYHRGLLRDWFANISNPQAHQRGIDLYLDSLPSNQKKKRGRKSQ